MPLQVFYVCVRAAKISPFWMRFRSFWHRLSATGVLGFMIYRLLRFKPPSFAEMLPKKQKRSVYEYDLTQFSYPSFHPISSSPLTTCLYTGQSRVRSRSLSFRDYTLVQYYLVSLSILSFLVPRVFLLLSSTLKILGGSGSGSKQGWGGGLGS